MDMQKQRDEALYKWAAPSAPSGSRESLAFLDGFDAGAKAADVGWQPIETAPKASSSTCQGWRLICYSRQRKPNRSRRNEQPCS